MPEKCSRFSDVNINSSCELGACRTNCKKNVNCFSQLGEKFWFSDIKETYWVSPIDSESERRIKGNHVGLKNLGATCYVNTILQLSFHNKAFRSAIYQWKFSDGFVPKLIVKDSNADASKSLLLEFDDNQTNKICGNLQYLFALLELSNRRYVDPSSFVECLGLQTNEQQDAQEFSKLFVTLLNNAFSSQDGFLSNIIHSQFGGQYKYETKCNVCLNKSVTCSDFYELDLNVKGHSSLHGCLKEFLQEEIMEGENQYFCSICCCKQNALRKIVLEKLPPVLKLNLLRFVFERETGTKKKINTALNFPETIDMGKYIKFDNPEDGLYHLSSVLIHRGLSAHSGHYIAHIYDEENNIWCRFNDEEVTIMKGKTLQLGVEDNLEDFGETKSKKPRKCDQDTKNHNSKNAYMLVYTKTVGYLKSHTFSAVPNFMKQAVEKDNQLFDTWVSEQNNNRKIAINAGLEKKRSIQTIFERLIVQNNESFEWISVKWLKEWLNHENRLVPPIDNTELMCIHAFADPNKLNQMKRISFEAAEILFDKYGGLPRLKSICAHCLEFEKRKEEFEEELNEDMKILNYLLKPNNKVNLENGKSYWIGKKSLKKIKLLAQQEFVKCKTSVCQANEEGIGKINEEIQGKSKIENFKNVTFFNEDCLCSHGDLCISEGSRKLVSEEVWCKCRKYFPKAPEFLSCAQPCELCAINKSTHNEESAALKLLAVQQKQALCFLLENPINRMAQLMQQNGIYHIIQYSFIDAWKKSFRAPHKALLTTVDNSDIICEHGLSLYQAEELIDEACKSDPQVYMISASEQNLVMNFLSFSHHISVSVSQLDNCDSKIFAVMPDYCVECRNMRLAEEIFDSQQYKSAHIYVTRRVVPQQTKNIKPNSKIDCDTECKVMISPIEKSVNNKFLKRSLEKISNDENRRSARRQIQFGEQMFRVDSDNTLKQLKIQLMHRFSVLPMDQTVMLTDGTLLDDDSKSLLELGIKVGSHLVLEVQKIDPENDITHEPVKSRTLEEGFKGTSLLSGL
ncbi:ubiquitin carboxyl-terminal hydrolase 48 isoform X3 [Hydra vulgaris]|uniref:ubiquitinyl hydrolase 1 n=1 Tax=Hydra vulgaris TaxID=6087 RepID=A0ABM4C2X9_HYDVU